MLSKFVSQTDFNSYEEFVKSFKICVPDNFNFAYDVVDEIASTTPEKIAIVWCNDKGEEAVFTFGQLKYYSDKTANFFKNAGIKKGDPVMLILKRRYEFWFCILALHKLGAVCIPATHLLTSKDIIYRNNAADIKMIVTVNEEEVIKHVENAQEESPTLKSKVLVGGSRDGWYNFNSELEKADENFVRPTGE
ncbi:MAG TPA: AMP-binding protein, partial [Clostridium sp.]|nr:AMP-binding protein [Clostridium sp.]